MLARVKKIGILTISNLLVLLTIIACGSNNKLITADSSKLLAASTATALPATASPALTATLPATPTAIPKIAITPTPRVGEPIVIPYMMPGGDITLLRTNQPPVISQKEALQVLEDAIGMNFTTYDSSKTFAYYGIGTVGREMDLSTLTFPTSSPRPAECKNWAGYCHIEIRTCKKGQCTATGQFIERYQNRPMWIIVFEGRGMLSSGGTTSSHIIYGIDAETRSNLFAESGHAPKP